MPDIMCGEPVVPDSYKSTCKYIYHPVWKTGIWGMSTYKIYRDYQNDRPFGSPYDIADQGCDEHKLKQRPQIPQSTVPLAVIQCLQTIACVHALQRVIVNGVDLKQNHTEQQSEYIEHYERNHDGPGAAYQFGLVAGKWRGEVETCEIEKR